MSSADISETWDRIFSASNFESYAHAAVKLYETLDYLARQEFTTLVYPSRGTTPFANLVGVAHRLYPTRQPHKRRIFHSLNEPFSGNTIELPFTADCSDETPGSSSSIRDYWVQVLRAMLCGDAKNESLRIYQYTLENLFGFSPLHGTSLHKPSPRFVFVDTVVSGRAVHEIVKALERHGLDDFHLVLLIDNHGKNLQQPYLDTIAAMERSGRATRICVESIFTEDRGPAMTSTWCLIAPQLAAKVPMVLGESAVLGIAGSAVSFIGVQYSPLLGNLHSTMMGARLYMALESYMDGIIRDRQPDSSERLRLSLLSQARVAKAAQQDPISPSQTKEIAIAAMKHGMAVGSGRLKIRMPVQDIDVSSSHVLRLKFLEAHVDRFFRDYSLSNFAGICYKHEA